MAYWDALGVSVDPVTTYEEGRHCVVGGDRFACWELFRQGRLSAWSWLWEWLEPANCSSHGAIRSPDSHESFSTFGL